MTIFVLAYVSAAVKPFSQAELTSLLQQCRQKNQRLNVTGMLLYKDGSFMQVLEGEKETVLALMDDIKADPRHHRIYIILQEFQASCDFEGWSMGFKCLDDKAPEDLPGYTDYLNLPLNSAVFRDSPTKSHALLRCFRQLGECASA